MLSRVAKRLRRIYVSNETRATLYPTGESTRVFDAEQIKSIIDK